MTSFLAGIQPPAKTLTWQTVVEWLPPDSETLLVVQEPNTLNKDQTSDALRHMLTTQASGWELLPNLFESQPDLLSAKRLFALEEARCFRGPLSEIHIGAYCYEGCHITVFDESSIPIIERTFSALKAQAKDTFQLQDHKVLHMIRKNNGSGTDTFIAHPRPEVIMVATQRAYLDETLKRVTQANKARAFPPRFAHLEIC